MNDETRPGEKEPTTARDWARAALFIAAIVILVTFLITAGFGTFWGCGATYGC